MHYWWLGTDGDSCRAILRVRGGTRGTIWRAMCAAIASSLLIGAGLWVDTFRDV